MPRNTAEIRIPSTVLVAASTIGLLMSMTAFLILGSAHFFDYASFLVMTSRHGLMAEYNPLVVALAQLLGLLGLTLVKVASVVLLTAGGHHHQPAATQARRLGAGHRRLRWAGGRPIERDLDLISAPPGWSESTQGGSHAASR